MATTDDRTLLYVVRHGATKWSKSGQHTSVTDLSLCPDGISNARKLGERLQGIDFGLVLSSPRRRALETAANVGFDAPEVDEDLAEWAYGPGEGLTSDEIRQRVPDWRIWTHGAPQFAREGYAPGETKDQVHERLARVVDKVRASGVERAIAFGHGHSLRALAMVWLGQDIAEARQFPLETGTLSVLGYEKENPAIVHWNAES